MQYRQLFNTDLKLSLLGLGTVKFARNTDVKYPHKFELPNKQQIIDLINQAKDYGINVLDTAPAYGNSESILGELFKDSHNNINRADWVLITKAGEDYINQQSCYNFSADHVNNSLSKSLKNLNTDYIDILLIHSDGNDQAIADNDKLWQLLEHRKKLGDIKTFGVSSKTIEGGLNCLQRSDLAMVTYRQDYLDELPLLDYALKNNKNIILKKALNSGHASDAKQNLQFCINHPAVTSIIIGTLNPAHLMSNAQAVQ
jgi:aryl-alcohol dehydrogenase-like predicted oxidoreductase